MPMKVFKIILKIIFIISLLVNSAGQGYALRPMASGLLVDLDFFQVTGVKDRVHSFAMGKEREFDLPDGSRVFSYLGLGLGSNLGLGLGSNRISDSNKTIVIGGGNVIATDSGYSLTTGEHVIFGCVLVIIQAFVDGQPYAYTSVHIGDPVEIAQKAQGIICENGPIHKAVAFLRKLVGNRSSVKYQAMVIGKEKATAVVIGKSNPEIVREGLEKLWHIEVPDGCYYVVEKTPSFVFASYDGSSAAEVKTFSSVARAERLRDVGLDAGEYRLESASTLAWDLESLKASSAGANDKPADIPGFIEGIPIHPSAEEIDLDRVASEKDIFKKIDTARRILSERQYFPTGPPLSETEILFLEAEIFLMRTFDDQHAKKHFIYRISPYKERILSLRDKLIELRKRAALVLKNLDALVVKGELNEVSTVVEGELLPILKELYDLIENAYALHHDVAFWYKDETIRNRVNEQLRQFQSEFLISVTPKIYLKKIRIEYDKIKAVLTSYFWHDEKADKGAVDLNRVALTVWHNGRPGVARDITFSRKPRAALKKRATSKVTDVLLAGVFKEQDGIDESDIAFICLKISDFLTGAAIEAEQKALGGVLKNNRFYDVLLSGADRFAESREWAVVRKVVYPGERSPVNMSINNDGSIEFRYSTIPEIFYHLLEGFQGVGKELGICQAIAESYKGNVEIKVLPQASTISVSLNLPLRVRKDEQSYGAHVKRLQRHIDQAMPMRPNENSYIVLGRTVTLKDGSKKVYDANFRGSALLSNAAKYNLNKVLEIADKYIIENPELDSLELDLPHRIFEPLEPEEACEKGILIVRFYHRHSQADLDDAFEPEDKFRSIAHLRFSLPFEWPYDVPDMPKKTVSQKKADQLIGKGQDISISMRFFTNPVMEKLIWKVLDYAQPLHLMVKHDEAEELADDRDYYRMMHNMLTELIATLDRIKKSSPDTRLKINLSQVITLKIDDLGKTDKLFLLEVYNPDNNLITTGYFSKKHQKFICSGPDDKVVSFKDAGLDALKEHRDDLAISMGA